MSMKRIATALVSAVIVLAATTAMANPYKKYEGTTIVVSWPALSHFAKAETLIDEFMEETGIEVEIDALRGFMGSHVER